MSESATLVPITDLMPIFAAIGERNWSQFKVLEREFANKHGIDVWEDVFNFRLKPALDKESDRWLLVQWCGAGIKSVKVVG